MTQYQPTGFSVLPTVVKNLIIINVLFFLATLASQSVFGFDLDGLLGLHFFKSSEFKAFQLITYMFMHGNFGHLFFNMFALWMFGNTLENIWGPKRFLLFYFVCGIGAALLQEVVTYVRFMNLISGIPADVVSTVLNEGAGVLARGMNYADSTLASLNTIINSNTVGASGAIYGILLAFGMMFPDSRIYLYFFIPIKAKWFVAVYAVIELVSGITLPGDHIAHFAHLGGMLFGLLLIRYWKKKGSLY